MKRLEHKALVDREGWESGPWDTEPDKVQWLDEETGLPCLIHRNRMGAWCGYVGVSKDHPAYEKSYNADDVMDNLEVHGGLTYSDKCAGSVCHEVESGEDDDVWWLGFDCCHYMDLAPGAKFLEGYGHTYRDQAYVTRQVELLAQQLKGQAT